MGGLLRLSCVTVADVIGIMGICSDDSISKLWEVDMTMEDNETMFCRVCGGSMVVCSVSPGELEVGVFTGQQSMGACSSSLLSRSVSNDSKDKMDATLPSVSNTSLRSVRGEMDVSWLLSVACACLTWLQVVSRYETDGCC